MVAVMGIEPVLVAVNPGILPLPLAPSPIAVLELVHVKVPPEGMLVKFVAPTVALLQMVMLAGTDTEGVGFTAMVNEDDGPVQPLSDGVTVIVAMIVVNPVLVAVNDAIFPEPPVVRPIAALELVQV